MTLQRMIFFVGFFIASATSTIFTANHGRCALSVEADTGFPPPYAPHEPKPRILQEPKMLERPKPGIPRRLMTYMGMRRTLWLIDALKGMCCRKRLTMAEEYYTAHTVLTGIIAELNENGLLTIQDTLDEASIVTYSFAQLDTTVPVFHPLTSFVNKVKSYIAPLRRQTGILQNLIKITNQWKKKNPRGHASIITGAITDLSKEYTSLIEQLEHLINFTIKLERFKTEQQYAAKIALPQGPQLRLRLEGDAAGA